MAHGCCRESERGALDWRISGQWGRRRALEARGALEAVGSLWIAGRHRLMLGGGCSGLYIRCKVGRSAKKHAAEPVPRRAGAHGGGNVGYAGRCQTLRERRAPLPAPAPLRPQGQVWLGWSACPARPGGVAAACSTATASFWPSHLGVVRGYRRASLSRPAPATLSPSYRRAIAAIAGHPPSITALRPAALQP